MSGSKKVLVIISMLVLSVLSWSVVSLTKLGVSGDGDPILSPLRIINRNVEGLSLAVLGIIIYLWKKDK